MLHTSTIAPAVKIKQEPEEPKIKTEPDVDAKMKEEEEPECGLIVLNTGLPFRAAEPQVKKESEDKEEKDEPLPKCTKGYGCSYGRFAPNCVTWRCECPLKGKCTPSGNKLFCQKPCLKHFPNPPYECKGGRAREMPNGCIIWQCNCVHALMSDCVKPALIDTDDGRQPICKDPCTVHRKKPSCPRCGLELTDLQCKNFYWGKRCDLCKKKDDEDD